MVGGRKKKGLSACLLIAKGRLFVSSTTKICLIEKIYVCLSSNRKKTVISLSLPQKEKKNFSLSFSLSSPNRPCGFIGLAGGTFRNRRGNSPWRCRPGCRWRRRRRGSSWWPTNCCRSWRRTQPRGRSCRGAACLCIPAEGGGA